MHGKSAPIARAAVALLALVAGLVVASPAQAAGYRDLKSVRYGTCVYAYADALEDIYLKRCSTTPAKFGNWTTVNVGYYNNHPLWVIRRQSGTCLGIAGTASGPYLYSACLTTGSKNVWEVFTTTSGRYVLKSFGAYQSWRQHKCLTFGGPMGGGRPQLGSCNLTSTVDQIYK